MEEQAGAKKSRRLKLVIIGAAMVAALLGSVFLYIFLVGNPNQGEISDPANDVELTVGTDYPGVIDIVHAALEAKGKNLTITIEVRDPVTDLGDDGFAQYNLTLMLDNGDLDSYEVCVEFNSSNMRACSVKLGESAAQPLSVEYSQNSIVVKASFDELQIAKEIQWFVLSTFERYSGDELVSDASDIAPDDSLQTTVLKQ